jgi:hypothetical protein
MYVVIVGTSRKRRCLRGKRRLAAHALQAGGRLFEPGTAHPCKASLGPPFFFARRQPNERIRPAREPLALVPKPQRPRPSMTRLRAATSQAWPQTRRARTSRRSKPSKALDEYLRGGPGGPVELRRKVVGTIPAARASHWWVPDHEAPPSWSDAALRTIPSSFALGVALLVAGGIGAGFAGA